MRRWLFLAVLACLSVASCAAPDPEPVAAPQGDTLEGVFFDVHETPG